VAQLPFVQTAVDKLMNVGSCDTIWTGEAEVRRGLRGIEPGPPRCVANHGSQRNSYSLAFRAALSPAV
jgi:hypothetical protein